MRQVKVKRLRKDFRETMARNGFGTDNVWYKTYWRAFKRGKLHEKARQDSYLLQETPDLAEVL